jgi:hypothetical protein
MTRFYDVCRVISWVIPIAVAAAMLLIALATLP